MTAEERATLTPLLQQLRSHHEGIELGIELMQRSLDRAQHQWDLARTNLTDAINALQIGETQTLEQIGALIELLESFTSEKGDSPA